MSATRIRPSEVRQAQRFMAPERSLQQRLDALEAANKVRVFRATWKKEVKLGEREILEPFHTLSAAGEDGETLWDTMKVLDYLVGIPQVGQTKAKKWLALAGISPSKTLGGMSARQRGELQGLIRAWMRTRQHRSAEYHRELVRRITER